MKKLLFLQAAMAFVFFSCELDLGTLGDGEVESPIVESKVSAELVMTPAPEYGYWQYKRKNDTTYTLIPKYYKVDGTHTYFDKVDPSQSYVKTDTGTITWQSEFPNNKMITNRCSLTLFSTNDNTRLSWDGWMTVRFPPESTIYFHFSDALGSGKLQKVKNGNLSMNGIFQYTPMSFHCEGVLWLYQ